MHKSYTFTRPRNEQSLWKRPRRKIYSSVSTESTLSESFSYKCYDCNTPYEMSSIENSEIECSNCSSRVIKKETSKKPHVLEAI